MSNTSLPKLIAIVGPTASGKTAIGITLARQGVLTAEGGEIISADSRQVYRGMDIGTAKARRDANSDAHTYISQGIPHHLVDIRDPDEDYAVGEFKRDAETAIDDIITRGRLPILVGGTGLYVRAVIENLDIPDVAGDPALRCEIEADIAANGLADVFEKLVALDPEAAYVVDPRNPRRVVRALEVATLTGKPFTAQRRHGAARYDVLELGITAEPKIVRERIDQRIDEMMHDGLVDEVKRLLSNDARREKLPTAFDAIGYREIIDYLNRRVGVDGKPMSLSAAVTAMKLNTWHFARRQMTWFRKDKNVRWVRDVVEAMAAAKKFLTA